MDDDSRGGLPPRIYVLDGDAAAVRAMLRTLEDNGCAVEGFLDTEAAMGRVREAPPDLTVLDVSLGDGGGIDLMQRLKAAAPGMEVVLTAAEPSVPQAVEATRKGAADYLEKPLDPGALCDAVTRALGLVRHRRRRDLVHRGIRAVDHFGEIIGATPAMKAVFGTISKVAPLDCNVLLQGESGTGKELVARALHDNSPRRDRPFIPVNCGAFTDELIASEIFGHEKGAFTGAVSTKLGLLETADGGTVFLDEIGEMPLGLQVKLLRVIQERSFMRVGGTVPVSIDVRFIAATNRDLDRMVAAGGFRQDLYYRLKVVTIDLPPLRQRIEDLDLLAAHFVRKAAGRFGKKAPMLSREILAELRRYSFPGNVRELENIIERAVALCQGRQLRLADLPPDLLCQTAAGGRAPAAVGIRDLEMEHIARVYRETGYNQSETARLLGISRTTLWRRLRRMAADEGRGR